MVVTENPSGTNPRFIINFPRKRPSAAKPNSTSKLPRQTASWAGNSPNVIHRHYKALVKEADAKEFWEITPATVKSQIAKLPTQAAAA